MPVSVTEPLLKDHNQLRQFVGELKANLDQFNLAGLRRTVRRIQEVTEPHALKEESALYLIGMKSLRADNEKLPELFREHHELAARLNLLLRALYSPQLTNVEDTIRNQAVLVAEELLDHLEDEEKNVFPALEQLLDDETKQLILKRMSRVAGDEEDELLSRAPLISLPMLPGENDLDSELPA